MSSPQPPPAPQPTARTFRLPGLAYLAVLFLVFCVAPLAFSKDFANPSGPAGVGPQTLVLVIPAVAAIFIARTATVVDRDGIRVRAAFGSRTLPWSEIRGLSLSGRSVFAVVDDGAVRLPCVRLSDLAALSRSSGGHLPEVAEAAVKEPPTRRMRRR